MRCWASMPVCHTVRTGQWKKLWEKSDRPKKKKNQWEKSGPKKFKCVLRPQNLTQKNACFQNEYVKIYLFCVVDAVDELAYWLASKNHIHRDPVSRHKGQNPSPSRSPPLPAARQIYTYIASELDSLPYKCTWDQQ